MSRKPLYHGRNGGSIILNYISQRGLLAILVCFLVVASYQAYHVESSNRHSVSSVLNQPPEIFYKPMRHLTGGWDTGLLHRHRTLTVAPSGSKPRFISSDISYSNGSFSISNETLYFNSTYSRPITVFVNDSRLLIKNSILRINERIGNYSYFLLTGHGSVISIVNSEVIEGAAVVSFIPVISLNDTFLSVNSSAFLSNGELLNTLSSPYTEISGSWFSGNGTLVQAKDIGTMTVEGTTFSVNGTTLDSTSDFGGIISVYTAFRFTFLGNSISSFDENAAYGMIAGNVKSFQFFNSTFTFSGQNSSEPGFDRYGMYIFNSSSLSIENDIVSGNEIAVSITGSAYLNFSNLKTNQSEEGLSLALDNSIKVAYSEFYGGTYGLLITDSSHISTQDNYFHRTLFGMRLIGIYGAYIEATYEQYVISSLQIVDSHNVSVVGIYDILIPYEFNFLEFYGITVAGSKSVTLDSVLMQTGPDSSGGFIDGLSVVYSNFTSVRDLHAVFSGQFVSTAVTFYNSANDSFTNSSVLSEGTSGDTGLWIVNSENNTIQAITLYIVGQQAVLMQNSTGNLLASTYMSVDGASTSGLYAYNSWHNRFENLTIDSEGYNAETGIVFQNSSFNSFSNTYVGLTGSFSAELLAKSIDSSHNSFRGFDYYSSYVYLEWVATSLTLALLSATGLFIAVTRKTEIKIARDDKIRFKRVKL